MGKEQKTGKQPYIPLYIGDWEKDTNTLSLEAEGGWLKIVFKMFNNGKTGVYKISAKGLQNLWKRPQSGIEEIVTELKDADVCELEVKNGVYIFGNRRMIKQYNISKVRSKAAQERYK